ncbi:MAG: hypothetical protein QFE16_16770 [Pseudomonadota bacterium]|nr:hypothetical protein [Pseudomonadota bacterium]
MNHPTPPTMNPAFIQHAPGHPMRKSAALAFVKALFAQRPDADPGDVLAKIDARSDLRKSNT